MRSFSRIAFSVLLLAACSERILAGQAWTPLSSLPFRATSIAADPGTPGALWATVAIGQNEARLEKSADGGKTWVDVSTGCEFPAYYIFVAVNPSASGSVIASASNCGFLGSVDGGLTWTRLASGLDGYGEKVLFDPMDRSILYSEWSLYGDCPGTCFFKSTDGGRSWKTTGLPSTDQSDVALAIDPSVPEVIYVGTRENGVFRSADGGSSWAQVAPGVLASAISPDPSNPTTVFLGAQDGVYRSDDRGQMWARAGLDGIHVNAYAFDIRSNPSTVYAGTSNGVYRSRDAGTTWAPLHDGLTGPIDALVLGSGRAPVLYALSAQAVYALALDGAPVPYLVPSSAHARGANGAFYTTDLTIANPGAVDATFAIRFLGHDADGTDGPLATRMLAAGRAVTYADVLGSLFGVESGYGAFQVTSDSGALKITAFTSTLSPDGRGRVGQAVPAFDASRLATSGSPAVLVGLRDDASARTNLVLANASLFQVTVELTLSGPDGAVLGHATWELPPLGMTQVASAVSALGGSAAGDAYLVVRVATAGGAVAAYASVVDNGTNDPRTILP